jgi:hypothetical protein
VPSPAGLIFPSLCQKKELTIAPEKRIPLVGKYASFKFSENDANGNLHKWLEGRWFAPNHFSDKVLP